MKARYAFIITVAILGLSFILGRFSYRHFADSKASPAQRSSAESSETALPAPADHRPSPPIETPSYSETLSPELARTGELLLHFRDETAYQRFLDKAEASGLVALGRNDRLRALRIRTKDAAETALARELAGDAATLEPNYLVVAPPIPAPLASSEQAAPFANRALDWMGVPSDNREWGKGVAIAVLDTGVSEHSILNESLIERVSILDTPASDAAIYNGHGTAIASLLTGEGVGIAPAAEVISIQVMDADGIGDSFSLANGIMEAVDRGASVITMSLGSYGYTSVLHEAVRYAQEQGAVLVAAAGNDGIDAITYPARFEGVIGVSAVDANSQRASFSNYSDDVDIAAPGVGVYAAWSENQWVAFSGTSAATPYVAGSIAAILSLEPSLSPNQASQLLFQHADDASAPGMDPYLGHGTLNMDRVLKRDEADLRDAAVADLYLDLDNASESSIPLLVTVQNRGTEPLDKVILLLAQQGGFPQEIYLGSLQEGQTASYALYLSKGQLQQDGGYAVEAQTAIEGTDARPDNNQKKAVFQQSE